MKIKSLASKAKRFLFAKNTKNSILEEHSLKKITINRNETDKNSPSLKERCQGAQFHHDEIIWYRLRKLLANCSWMAEHYIDKVMLSDGNAETERRRKRLFNALEEFKLAATDIKKSDLRNTADIDMNGLDRSIDTLVKNIINWTDRIKIACLRADDKGR